MFETAFATEVAKEAVLAATNALMSQSLATYASKILPNTNYFTLQVHDETAAEAVLMHLTPGKMLLGQKISSAKRKVCMHPVAPTLVDILFFTYSIDNFPYCNDRVILATASP